MPIRKVVLRQKGVHDNQLWFGNLSEYSGLLLIVPIIGLYKINFDGALTVRLSQGNGKDKGKRKLKASGTPPPRRHAPREGTRHLNYAER